jgi:ABC-type oligopeptide transport system substrate-binding subunit
MKNLKSTFTIAFAILFISAMSFTSCGGKKEANNESDTEHVEGGEHPAEAEHPAAANSTEHPTDN